MGKEKRDTIAYARENDVVTAITYVSNPKTRGSKAKAAAVAAFIASCCAAAILATSKL